ncbi:hypothetical protein V1478_002993 [Vespula squamosa]|uniref:Uncharacterized protein n=1 Tax=Vespula squamosa TaxID=30214 RepID=A0ABD2BRE4_VESSQ
MSLSNVPKPPLKKIQLDDCFRSRDGIKPSRHLIAKALASKSVCGQAFLLASVSQAIKSRNLFQADSTGQWEDPSRVPTSDWSIGVPNNVFDFGFQRTSADMYV